MPNINPGIYSSEIPPKIAHLKPSIAPTIGFIEYNNLHLSGTTEELYPTGETYNPNWTTNGITYRKSRYLAFSEAIHSPGPRHAKKAIMTKIGKVNNCQLGINPNQTYRPNNKINETIKSARETTTEAVGIINLGK